MIPANTVMPIEDEIAALLEEAGPDPDALRGLADEDARRLLTGLLLVIRRERAAITDAEAWARVVAEEAERANAPRRQRVAFLEDQVYAVAERLIPEGKKSVDVPGVARVQYRDIPEGVQIEDDEAFIACLGADERELLVEMRPHLRRNEAKGYATVELEASGQLLPGVVIKPATRSSSIQWGR